MSDEPLKLGTLKCPSCKENLHFEVMGTMRVKHKVSDHWEYRSYCPPCHKYYDVIAPKETK